MTVSTFMRSKARAFGATVALLIVALVLAACAVPPLAEQPAAEMGDAPQTETYTDENGLFTAEYPAGWVVVPYGFEGDPTPNVSFGSNQEILELSMMNEPLPEDQIGLAVILLHRDMLAEAGVTAETPLEEIAQMVIASMAPEQAEMAEATYESTTLADGTPAVRITMAAPTEAYVVRLADMGDGVLLLAPQILALDYENAELEAQIEAIANSVEVTASGEEVMAFIMSNMGGVSAAETGDAPQTETYTDENGLFTAEYPAGWIVDPYGFGAEDPTPHVNFGSDREILELSMAGETLPEDQIGGSVILLHRAMLAEAGVTAETPLEEIAQMVMASMAPDEVQAGMAEATYESTALADGTPAVRINVAAPTEAVLIRLADMGDGILLLAPQILAPDYENAELEAQIEAIANSVEVTASGEEVMAVIMERMGATGE